MSSRGLRGSKILREMFLGEATPIHQAQAELNRSTSVAQSPRKFTPSTAKMQSDVDSGSSVAKKNETAGPSGAGLRITGDKATLGALLDALQEAASGMSDDQDKAEWAEQAYKVCAAAFQVRGGGEQVNVSLPPYQETPELDSFNDDEGSGPEDEGY